MDSVAAVSAGLLVLLEFGLGLFRPPFVIMLCPLPSLATYVASDVVFVCRAHRKVVVGVQLNKGKALRTRWNIWGFSFSSSLHSQVVIVAGGWCALLLFCQH